MKLAESLQTLADTPPLMTAESADNSSPSMAQAPVTAITLSLIEKKYYSF